MAYILKDSERSAYGLGWEHKRRGLPIDSNPFAVGAKRFGWFRQGWSDYTEDAGNLYARPDIVPDKQACGVEEDRLPWIWAATGETKT